MYRLMRSEFLRNVLENRTNWGCVSSNVAAVPLGHAWTGAQLNPSGSMEG